MLSSKDTYVSYLLRLRRVHSDTGRSWMASLLSTSTSAEQRFTDVQALVEFLQSEFSECDPVIDTERSIERSEQIP